MNESTNNEGARNYILTLGDEQVRLARRARAVRRAKEYTDGNQKLATIERETESEVEHWEFQDGSLQSYVYRGFGSGRGRSRKR